MKKLLLISFILFSSFESFSQGEEQFKSNLKDSIQTALKHFNGEDDKISISIKKDDYILTQIITCNNIFKDSINNGCFLVYLSFDLNNKYRLELRNQLHKLNINNLFNFVITTGDKNSNFHSPSSEEATFNEPSSYLEEHIDIVCSLIKKLYNEEYSFLSIETKGTVVK